MMRVSRKSPRLWSSRPAFAGGALIAALLPAAAGAETEYVRLEIGDQPLTIPAEHIWNRELQSDGPVGSVNLFFVLPDMGPVTPEMEGTLDEPGFGPVVLANLTTLSFGLTVEQRFEQGVERGHWSIDDLDLAQGGLQPVRGPLSDADVQDWNVLVEGGEVRGLITCTDEEVAPYPSCTAYLDLWDRLALIVNFDATRQDNIASIADDLAARLNEFRVAAEGVDL